MSVSTKRGDDGFTELMYGRKVPKDHPQVEAYGTVDELNVILGFVKAQTRPHLENLVESIQKDLYRMMSEMCVMAEDMDRWVLNKGRDLITDVDVNRITDISRGLETLVKKPEGNWSTPGATEVSVRWDMVRVVCRRAERRVVAYLTALPLRTSRNVNWISYLNRLSDLAWLLSLDTH